MQLSFGNLAIVRPHKWIYQDLFPLFSQHLTHHRVSKNSPPLHCLTCTCNISFLAFIMLEPCYINLSMIVTQYILVSSLTILLEVSESLIQEFLVIVLNNFLLLVNIEAIIGLHMGCWALHYHQNFIFCFLLSCKHSIYIHSSRSSLSSYT